MLNAVYSTCAKADHKMLLKLNLGQVNKNNAIKKNEVETLYLLYLVFNSKQHVFKLRNLEWFNLLP